MAQQFLSGLLTLGAAQALREKRSEHLQISTKPANYVKNDSMSHPFPDGPVARLSPPHPRCDPGPKENPERRDPSIVVVVVVVAVVAVVVVVVVVAVAVVVVVVVVVVIVVVVVVVAVVVV